MEINLSQLLFLPHPVLPPLILDGTATEEAEIQQLSETVKKSPITSSEDNLIEFRLIDYVTTIMSLCSAGTSPSD